MSKLSVKFLGASKTVTGSCYLLEYKNNRYLVDCGMFQGPDVFELNYEDFKFTPSEISTVFLTHAHIDHCGLIPKLVSRGFKGKILCTQPTSQLLNLILMDSARVQENNFKFKGIAPLYTTIDSEAALLNVISTPFDKQINFEDFTVTYRKASHILGAASIEFNINDNIVTFSGDLGRVDSQIISGYDGINKTPSVVIMESLYGGQAHEILPNSLEKLSNIINQSIESDGNVIIPVFAVHRLQEMLYHINKLILSNKIPDNVQIFIDAPLGVNVLNLYTQSKSFHSDYVKLEYDPFGLENPFLKIIKSNKQSLKLRNKKGAIILSGGGMMEGGRIINHLHSFIGDKNSSLVIVGYQAEGTLGNEISKKPEQLTFDGKTHQVKINIQEVNGFSAHADNSDLLWWLSRFDKKNLQTIFLTHADIERSSSFKTILESDTELKDTKILIPDREDLHTFEF